MRYEDIYDGLEVYSKPATAESELYAQLKAFNILNILHSQLRFGKTSIVYIVALIRHIHGSWLHYMSPPWLIPHLLPESNYVLITGL